MQEYNSELETVQADIERIEKQIADCGNEEDFTTAFLLEFSRIQGEIDRLNALLNEDTNRNAAAAKVSVITVLLQFFH